MGLIPWINNWINYFTSIILFLFLTCWRWFCWHEAISPSITQSKIKKIKLQGIVVITRNKMNSEIWVKKNFLLYIFIFHNFQQQFSLFIFHNRTFYFFTFLLIEGYLTTFNKLSFKEILNSFLTLDKFEIFGKEIAIFFFYLY